jgi:hypothetical protein
MAGMLIALVGIPLCIGVVLSVGGVRIVRAATRPNRRAWTPGEIAGAAVGFLIFGWIGSVGSATIALLCGFLPFLESPGHPALAAMMVFAGAMALGVPGAWFAGMLIRHYSKRGVFQR